MSWRLPGRVVARTKMVERGLDLGELLFAGLVGGRAERLAHRLILHQVVHRILSLHAAAPLDRSWVKKLRNRRNKLSLIN
jgi:hypothetical protein